MQYSLTYRLGGFVGDGISRTISGFAYPGETLTSTVAGQWFVDDVAVIGETGETYEVNLLDIGKPIRCDNSNALTCWKPQDIAGVAAFWWSRGGVLNSIDPDTLATDGQTVRRWADRTTPAFNANQTIGANQPIYRATGQSGGPSVEFDGSNDSLDISNGSEEIFRNKQYGYIFAGLRDTNPTGAQSQHSPVFFSTPTAGTTRLAILTRHTSGTNIIRVIARRLDDNAATSINSSVASDSNYRMITGEALWGVGQLRVRVDGAAAGDTTFPSSGATSNTGSLTSYISNPTTEFPGHIACVILANPSAPLSNTDRSRIERFIGLQGGLNITLV
jgi:hypothetical protein